METKHANKLKIHKLSKTQFDRESNAGKLEDTSLYLVPEQSLTIQLNSGTTEDTNKFTFDGSEVKTVNITPSAIGAAANSHGTHVKYSAAHPEANGTSTPGKETTVSRSDHVHPTDTSRASSTHTHGNIANDGTLSTASRIVVTGTDKKVTTGAIDPANLVVTTDSRLSDSRTPKSHASSNTTYGVGTSANYGHVKIQNDDLKGKQHANGVVAGLEHTHSQYAQLNDNMEVVADGVVSGNSMTLETQRGGHLDLINKTSDGTQAEVLLTTDYLHLSKQEPVNDEESSQINLYTDQLDISVRGPANTTEDYDPEITSGISVSPHSITIGDINSIDNDPEYDELEVDIDADRVNLNATYAQVNNSKIMTARDFNYNSSTGILTINTSWED